MKAKPQKTIKIALAILLGSICLLPPGCGGGGGSGSSEIASSSLSAEPPTIEVGGKENVTITLTDVSQDLAIKIRYPDALEYIPGSAVFINGNDNVATNPAYNISESGPSSSSSSTGSGGSSSSAAATPTPTPTPTPEPTKAGASSSKAKVQYSKSYLVFFLTKDAFGSEPNGSLSFSLRAKDIQEGGAIELDVDLDDPTISNEDEFSLAEPFFETEQAVDMRIRH